MSNITHSTVKLNKAEKQHRQLTVLQEVNKLVVSDYPVETILENVLNQLLTPLGYVAAQIYQLSASGKDVWLYLEVGKGRKPITQTPDIFSVEEHNIISDTVRQGTPLNISDVSTGPYSYHSSDNKEISTGSEIAIPVKYGKENLGVLRIECRHPNIFDQDDINYLVSLTNLLASTIRNNRKIRRLEDSIQEIRTLYSLQHQDKLEQQLYRKEQIQTIGYEYDNTGVKKSDNVPPLLNTITEQEGITTLQSNGDTKLFAPIQLHNETIGVLGLENLLEESATWTSDDMRLLEEVSSQVALAIENSRLLQQTQEQTNELSILFEATRQLTETIDLKQIFDILTSQTINYLGADECSVLLFGENNLYLEKIVAKARSKTNTLITVPEPRKETVEDFPLYQQMLKHSERLILQLDDPTLESKTRNYMTENKGQIIQTITRFPLIVRYKLIGILEVKHIKQRHTYTNSELQLAGAIISQVTVAIENAQLFQQTQESLEDTQKLYDISRKMVESTSAENIFTLILETVKSYNIDRVSISLIDRSAKGSEFDSVTIAASWDRDPTKRLPVGTRFSKTNFALVKAFANPPFHPLVSHNLHQPDNQDERMDDAFRQYAIRNLEAKTLFSAPMFLGTEYKGVLSIYTRTPHTYTSQEIRIYQTLADQAIIAIENYRLLDTTRRERDRASFLYELGQTLSATTSVGEVQNALLNFIPIIGATDGELYISDGADFVSMASTIPERYQLSNEELANIAVGNTHEALALGKQQLLVLTRHDAGKVNWPLPGETGLDRIQTIVCVPFFSQRSTMQGVLSLMHNVTDGFEEDQITVFESVAIQAAASLENAWLLRQTNIVLHETELLYNITRGFNSAQTINDLLHVLAQNLIDIEIDYLAVAHTPVPNNHIPLQRLDIVASWHRETDEVTVSYIKLPAKDFEFIKQLQPDTHTEINYNRLHANTQANINRYLNGVRTLLAVPLKVGAEWLGVLLLGSSQTNEYMFKVNTINQVSTLAGQAAVVIQNLQLVEETQLNLFNTEVLSNLGNQLLTIDTVETTYKLALSAIVATNPNRGAAIFMYTYVEEIIELEMVASWDNPRKEWPLIKAGSWLSTKELALAPLLKTGNTIVSKDGPEDERFSPALQKLLTMMQIKALVAVPIWIDKNVEGFILIGNETDTLFSTDHIRMYEDISRKTSGAIDNRRLFEEAQYRAWQLQTAADVSQAATGYLDLDTLLFESVDLIKERFNFYHASIFLVDEYQRYALVQASTGKIGQQMLAMKHKLEIGGKSIVGTATKTGKPRIALDVGKDASHFNNPLLPKTRSEMALPLIAQGQVIGALDVQSKKQGAFSDSDITVLQSMANQLANAIEAARAYQESKEALSEVSKLHQHYLMGQWNAYLKEQETTKGFQLTNKGQTIAVKTKKTTLPEYQKAIDSKKVTLISAQPSAGNGSNTTGTKLPTAKQAEKTSPAMLVAPLALHGQAVIGELNFEIANKNANDIWNEDILEIVEAVSNQAAQAIEAARLFEQSQAAREEAESLYDVGRMLVTAESEEEMFNTVLGKMLATLGLPQGGALLFNDDKQFGKLRALYRESKPVTDPNLEFPVAANLSYKKLIETKKPVAIEDMSTDPLVATVREMNLVDNIASLLLIPIIINDEVIGALGADAVGQTHKFTVREINLAMAMADQLSIALQNRRLIEETQRSAVLLQTSSDVARVATSILNQDQLMERTVELIRRRFGFYHVQIFLINDTGTYAVLHKSTGETGKIMLAAKHKLAVGSQNIIGQATAQRKPVVIRSTQEPNPDIPHYLNEFLPNTQAELGIPLQVGNTLIGALDVQSDKPYVFSDKDISTLETLAAQLAVAIQNARAFKEQQETAARLKEIDKLKTQFLANMSHELRTPLNSIIGFARVILKGIDGPLTELQKADLTSIHNSGKHLLGLINNILDLSKIEAGKMELNFEETEVDPIIKTIMSTAIALVKDKPVTLQQVIPENLPLIWADSTRIRQVVLNLVSNACKFTDEGSITTQVYVDDDKVVFSVSDTGIGIPEEKIEHIFEEFTQVDASTTRKVGGTGLGLPISRHFVEMHHGEIWVDSTLGYGTTMSFFIPTLPPSAQPATPESPLSKAVSGTTQKKLVVAIDDDTAVIDLYKRFLGQKNYEVIGINNGKNAVDKVKQYRPFAILLDIIIPERDGWSVIKDLKEDPFTKNIPVIICSIISDKNRGFSLGAANYLVKPIVENDLLTALKHLNTQQADEIKVLVVDDQADDVLLIKRILEAQANYTIFEARNGREGLELVETNMPDLIILDLNMPEMDGFAMIEVLKENEDTRNIPIIIVSAEELTRQDQDRLTGQVEVLLRKGIFTEKELLNDVSRALAQLQQTKEKPLN